MTLRKRAAIVCGFLAALFLFATCKKPTSSFLAIVHVTVIDLTGALPAPDQTVLIEKEKIVSLGPSQSISIPSGAKVVDGTGKFLMPGLADMHVHVTGAGEPDGSRKFMLPLLVANGITTVRDMGGYLESLVPLQKEIEEGKLLGPRIVFAGPYLDGDPPAFQPAAIVANRDDAEAAVLWLKRRGVDFIKVQSNLSRDAYFAIADAAKQQNIPFVGHVPDRVTAWEAADAGQKSIEHLTGVLRACSSDEPGLMREQFRPPPVHDTPENSFSRSYFWRERLLLTYSEENAKKIIAKFAEKHTWQTPTLILLKGASDAAFLKVPAQEPRLKYIPASEQRLWDEYHRANTEHAMPKEPVLRSVILEKSEEMVGAMQKGGVRILAGTDSPAYFVFPGSGLHEELALLVKAGLTPMEALQSATRNAAEFLERLDSQGTVAAGKNADLVLLDANPLDDIRNTQKIRAVILRGKLLGRSSLDSLLANCEKFARAN